MNIRVIKSEATASTNSTSRLKGTYKVNVAPKEIIEAKAAATASSTFKVGCRVRHVEEGILGEIKFIGSDRVAIVWADHSRERMSLAEAQDTLEYVDDTQSLVSPLSPQISDRMEEIPEDEKEKTKINDIVNEAISALDDESGQEPNGEEQTTDIDIEKIKMQRKINNMEQQLTAKQTNNMKESIAREVIELAIKKGMVEEDNFDLEIMSVTMLNDEDFAAYKQSVIDYKDDGHRIESDGPIDPAELDGLSPEERAAKQELKKLRKTSSFSGGGGGGSFSSGVDTDGESRNIKGAKQEKFTFYNQTLPPTFEEQFTGILSDAVDTMDSQPMRRTAAPRPAQQKSALPGFENLQGITKPLMPGACSKTAAYQSPTNTSLKDLFENMNWTTVSKIH